MREWFRGLLITIVVALAYKEAVDIFWKIVSMFVVPTTDSGKNLIAGVGFEGVLFHFFVLPFFLIMFLTIVITTLICIPKAMASLCGDCK